MRIRRTMVRASIAAGKLLAEFAKRFPERDDRAGSDTLPAIHARLRTFRPWDRR